MTTEPKWLRWMAEDACQDAAEIASHRRVTDFLALLEEARALMVMDLVNTYGPADDWNAVAEAHITPDMLRATVDAYGSDD
jgi:hypothetical protein